MKKSSTAALFLAFAAASSSFAASGETTKSRCGFLPNAPDQHTVVRGDTLWGISGKFLQQPWCWPQVWGMNREQIRDPHWIYPGQIVYLDRAAGRLRLGNAANGGAGGMPTVRLSPQIRSSGLEQSAISSIPSGVIEPFLSQPMIVEDQELAIAPRIMAAEEGRVVLGKGDIAYVRGELQNGVSFQAFRPGAALRDPDTGLVIGHEALFLGTLKLKRPARTADEAHVFDIVNVQQEMGIGDRLVPVPHQPIINYVPHPPEQAVDARIVSIYGGVSQAGQNQIVTINRGKNHGIDVGTVLSLYRFGRVVADPTQKNDSWSREQKLVKLPDQEYGNLFVFRVFNNLSYGLIMQVTDSVKIGDIARTPE